MYNLPPELEYFQRMLKEEEERRRQYDPDNELIKDAMRRMDEMGGIAFLDELARQYRDPIEDIIQKHPSFFGPVHTGQIFSYQTHLIDTSIVHKTWDSMNKLRESTGLSMCDLLDADYSTHLDHYRELERILSLREPHIPRRVYPETINSDIIRSIIGVRQDLLAAVADCGTEIINPATFASMPAGTVSNLTKSVICNCHLCDSLSTETSSEEEEIDELLLELDDEQSLFLQRIKNIDPVLASKFLGAVNAYKNGSYDKASHVLVYLRELLTIVLVLLAPDKEVLLWISSQESKEGLFNRKLPSRRARIKFIYASVDSPHIANLGEANANKTIELFELLNRLHDPNPNLNDMSLKIAISAVQCHITELIQTKGMN